MMVIITCLGVQLSRKRSVNWMLMVSWAKTLDAVLRDAKGTFALKIVMH